MELVLASQSKNRKKCFERAGISVTIIPSHFNEDSIIETDQLQKIKRIARAKGQLVKKIWLNQHLHEKGEALIISADTMGLFKDQLIGKPDTYSDAFNMIQQLCGTSHSVYTALNVMHTNSSKEEHFLSHSKVHFQSLTDQEIHAYLENNTEFLTRAASYSIIDRASLFIDHIEGSFSNIIGIPMAQLRLMLKKFGVELLKPLQAN